MDTQPTIWTSLQPILAQAARDFLRTVGTALAAHGYITNGGAGVEAFIGAGMTIAGLFWGWWTTSGYIQVGALLKKLTATKTPAEAVQTAQAMAPSSPVAVAKQIAPKILTPILLAAIVLTSLLVGPASAQVKLTGNPVKDFKFGTTNPAPAGTSIFNSSDPLEAIADALDAKLLPDLQYALKLATASNSNVTAPCYSAWIDIINTRQKAVMDDGTPPAPLPVPDPGVVTKFEKLVELRNALQPDSNFMIKCSPVASMVKKDIVGFIGIVISGGAGLATLVPGL